MTRPQTWDEKYHWIYFFGTRGAPAGQDSIGSFRIRVPFCSHRSGDGESRDGFGSQAKKKRAAFLARASTLYSFLFEDIALIERELGPTDEEVPYHTEEREINDCSKTTLSDLAPKTTRNRSPTVWVGTQCPVPL